jgi:hypothetical protein
LPGFCFGILDVMSVTADWLCSRKVFISSSVRHWVRATPVPVGVSRLQICLLSFEATVSDGVAQAARVATKMSAKSGLLSVDGIDMKRRVVRG